MPVKEAACLLVLGLALATVAGDGGPLASRFYVKKDRPPGGGPMRRSDQPGPGSARREANFDPDVLNRFLEEYASKIKRTTERPLGYEEDARAPQDSQDLELIAVANAEKDANDTAPHGFREPARLNDTVKRHKFYGASPQIEDRNSGWVTLDAIPWSKSKISKWQANPTTQDPWPDSKPWDKPSFNKPWNSDNPARPASYDSNNKPWHNKLTKPHWSDNAPSGSSKPWYSDRPRPSQHERPGYPAVDKYEENPNQAQKWPPERPSWERYGEPARPGSDIITDNAPPNFPTSTSWERPSQRPSYTHHTESYVNEPNGWHDRNDFPSNGKYKPAEEGYYDRPHFSQYQYPSSSAGSGPGYLSSHPSSGDGQWVLLSTNRGYTKSRQRSIKLEALVNAETAAEKQTTAKKNGIKTQQQLSLMSEDEEENVPAMTSKRQIRLTVLPSINGTNTTTSHGGMLEVERTFKTVDQSQKEYEQERIAGAEPAVRPIATKILLGKRPMHNGLTGSGPASSSAVLAAVGAGMLPATMAMMIPMMLGRRRRRRSTEDTDRLLATLVELTRDAGEIRRRRM